MTKGETTARLIREVVESYTADQEMIYAHRYRGKVVTNTDRAEKALAEHLDTVEFMEGSS